MWFKNRKKYITSQLHKIYVLCCHDWLLLKVAMTFMIHHTLIERLKNSFSGLRVSCLPSALMILCVAHNYERFTFLLFQPTTYEPFNRTTICVPDLPIVYLIYLSPTGLLYREHTLSNLCKPYDEFYFGTMVQWFWLGPTKKFSRRGHLSGINYSTFSV